MPFSQPVHILILAAMLALMVTFILAFPVIAFLRKKKLGQQIRDDGPQRHLEKSGTPTMGGLVIIAGVIAGMKLAWFCKPEKFTAGIFLLALLIAVAAIGSIDDWGKIKRGRSLGLRAREKLILQFIAATLFVVALVIGLGGGTTIGIPGVGLMDLGWFYWPFAIIYIAAMSNAVNLTDGLDGLAAGTTFAACAALAIIAWLAGEQGTAIFLACIGAACLAFLWFNRSPARVFMGDTGSLAIGAALAGAALVLKQEVLFLLIGLIFLIEMFSVIIQVIAFKTTGKRVFRMSPFHHHLELSGWSETRIVYSAWAFAVVLAAAAIYRFFAH